MNCFYGLLGINHLFFSLQHLSQHRCTSSSWPIASLIMQKYSEECIWGSSRKEEHAPWQEKSKMNMKPKAWIPYGISSACHPGHFDHLAEPGNSDYSNI